MYPAHAAFGGYKHSGYGRETHKISWNTASRPRTCWSATARTHLASSENTATPPRVLITEAAARLVRQLRDQYGPLLFHQSGGCCEGSAPMCLRRIGSRDVLLGVIADCPFYVSAEQFFYWAHSQLTIDVVTDGGDSFSLEAAEGVRFITRSCSRMPRWMRSMWRGRLRLCPTTERQGVRSPKVCAPSRRTPTGDSSGADGISSAAS
jgi:uncharacterized protein (DUF779 family)